MSTVAVIISLFKIKLCKTKTLLKKPVNGGIPENEKNNIKKEIDHA